MRLIKSNANTTAVNFKLSCILKNKTYRLHEMRLLFGFLLYGTSIANAQDYSTKLSDNYFILGPKRWSVARPPFNIIYITTSSKPSGQVKAVKVHHFVPCSYEVLYEFLPGVLTTVNFSKRPKFRVRA
jgi:hypothetical protein